MDIRVLDASKLGIGHGFDRRTSGVKPKTLLIHTTNGRIGSSYDAEADFIYNSTAIKSHYLVGKKRNQITQFLDIQYRAWHAGAVNDNRFNNNNSVGIENHYTPGEGAWPFEMHQNLDDLVRMLIKDLNITSPEFIETHRKVAIPKGRKIDPSGFPDAEFYLWRARLFEDKKPPFTRYIVIKPEVNIRTSPSIPIHNPDSNIVGTLVKGDVFESEALKVDEYGIYVHGINTWAHLTRGTTRGKSVNNLGFVHTSNLRVVE